MSSFLEIIRTEYKSEYSKKKTEVAKRYTEPKIYHGGKNYDLSKRWYVYYYFRKPDTGKWKNNLLSTTRLIEHTRQEKNGGIATFEKGGVKTFEARLCARGNGWLRRGENL